MGLHQQVTTDAHYSRLGHQWTVTTRAGIRIVYRDDHPSFASTLGERGESLNQVIDRLQGWIKFGEAA